MRTLPALFFAIFTSWTASGQFNISTLAGNGTQGFSGDNGPATSAQLLLPCGVAVDTAGNVYIADTQNNRVRKFSGGIITTLAGNGTRGFSGDSGPATSIQLFFPSGIAVDSAGNVYIADTGNNRIRRVSGGVITTVAGNGMNAYAPIGPGGFGGDGGSATSAQMNGPTGVAVDSAGNLYIADTGSNRIRRVSSGVITTVAGNGLAGFSGDGPAASVELFNPSGVAADSLGNLLISDSNNELVRKVSNGMIITIAGMRGTQVFGEDNGPATSAELNYPTGVAMDLAGNVYIADTVNNRIRLLTPTPYISQNGIVPIYSSVPVIQAGSWASIYGSALAGGSFLWDGTFSTSLGGTSVTINNRPAYLWLVSPTQINLQAPDDTATGLVDVCRFSVNGKRSVNR